MPQTLKIYLRFVHQGRRRQATATLKIDRFNERRLSCDLAVVYGHRSYTARFNVPSNAPEDTMVAIAGGIIQAIKGWGDPWPDVKEIEVDLLPS